MENIRNPYKILVGKPEGERPIGRPTRRLEDNIKKRIFREISWEGVDWMHLAQDRVQWRVPVNRVIMNLRVL
jgi:hypothetical protein